jgi:hypothetical protein
VSSLDIGEIIDARRRSPIGEGQNVGRVVVPFYRAIMLELERRRLQLSLPMDVVADRAGVADRYYSKSLYADSPSGRQSRWETLQDIVDSLFPEGYDIEIRPKTGLRLGPNELRCKIAFAAAATDKKSQRELLRALGKKGGEARREKYKTMSRAERLAIARKARKTRRRNRLLRAQLQKQQLELLSPL